jgi:TonB family protein
MFEFAIAQQSKHPPSRRFVAAMGLSVIGHLLTLAILIEYPQLLGSGLRKWLNQPILFSSDASKEPVWRTVTFLGGKGNKMAMPSTATLKQFVYDWEAHKDTGKAPPIRVRWNVGGADSAETKATAVPKPVPGLQEPKPVPQAAAPPAGTGEETAVGGGALSGAGVSGTGSAGDRGTTVYLPPPQISVEPREVAQKAPEKTGMVAPTAIPKETPAPVMPPANLSKGTSSSSPPKSQQTQIFENEQKAIRSEGSGFFDTKGFPLGEYASVIIERIKGNWSIPSNLRNSQGRTTVVFFIDKDGRFTDARIVTSSGSNSLDLAALNAVIGSNPFPPLPKGFPGEHVGAKFVFSYNERP